MLFRHFRFMKEKYSVNLFDVRCNLFDLRLDVCRFFSHNHHHLLVIVENVNLRGKRKKLNRLKE